MNAREGGPTWKESLLGFAKQFNHPSRGFEHYRRVYEMSKTLIEAQPIQIDEDALFASAFIHDAGAFEPYKLERVEHSDRSAQLADQILTPMGFPLEKLPLVRDIVRGHMFYAKPAMPVEAVIFHDADVLDYMGAIGIMRLLSTVGRDEWTPNTKKTIALIRRFSQELPGRLHTLKGQQIGHQRQMEMDAYINALADETKNFAVL